MSLIRVKIQSLYGQGFRTGIPNIGSNVTIIFELLLEYHLSFSCSVVNEESSNVLMKTHYKNAECYTEFATILLL